MAEDNIGKKIESKFGHRLRSRVNGVLIHEDKILMINHRMSDDREFWSVPGGGMIYGQNAKENLEREFLEETGLEIEVGKYLCVHEFLQPPLHAMEHFFEVKLINGNPELGIDPELSSNEQILMDLRWMSTSELKEIPKMNLHQMFWAINYMDDIGKWTGYFNFGNISIK